MYTSIQIDYLSDFKQQQELKEKIEKKLDMDELSYVNTRF